MRADDLIECLREYPASTEVAVWEGYDAGCVDQRLSFDFDPETNLLVIEGA